jgi:DNA-binding NtrC family response regulator
MKKKTILVVEDELVIQRLVKRTFIDSDYDMTIVGSVSEAYKKIETMAFHLLITDLRLPDGNGVSVIQCFKEKFPTSNVIIMTGSLTPETKLDEISNFKVDALHIKPFELDDLRLSIKKILGD